MKSSSKILHFQGRWCDTEMNKEESYSLSWFSIGEWKQHTQKMSIFPMHQQREDTLLLLKNLKPEEYMFKNKIFTLANSQLY